MEFGQAECKSSSGSRLYRWALLWLVLAFAALAVDLPLARFLAGEDRVPGDLHKLIMLAEAFAHGSGVILFLLAGVVLDPRRRRQFVRVAACAFGPGIAVNLLKLTVVRVRPHTFDLDATVWDSFAGWLPVVTGYSSGSLDSSLQSFPSGHAATAVGLAIGLSWLYPHGRWLFTALAALGCLQRLVAHDHYLSDTLTGTAVACCISGLCLDSRGWGAWFDRLERKRLIVAEPSRVRAA